MGWDAEDAADAAACYIFGEDPELDREIAVTDEDMGVREAEKAILDDPLFQPQKNDWRQAKRAGRDMTTSKPNHSTVIRRAIAKSQKAQADLEKLLAVLDRFHQEPEIGSVLKFKKTWPPTPRQVAYANRTGDPVESSTYVYAAIRGTNNLWYVTTGGTSTLSWEQLGEFIGAGECWLMVEGEEF